MTDTSHFDESGLDGMPDVLNTPEPKKAQAFSGNHLPFVGFSYSKHIPLVLNDSLSASPDISKRVAFLEREVQIAAGEKARLELALQNRSPVAIDPSSRDDTEGLGSLLKQLLFCFVFLNVCGLLYIVRGGQNRSGSHLEKKILASMNLSSSKARLIRTLRN